MAGMKPGTVGRPGAGMASTTGCGFCSYCRAGYDAQCDATEPRGGTAFFGESETAGAYTG